MRTQLFIASLALLLAGAALAQAPQAQQKTAPVAPAGAAAPARVTRPPLFLKEDWKQIAGGGEHPVTPASVTDPNVELKLYGASRAEIQLTGNDGDDNNPTHVWTGLCTTPCAVALRDKTRYVDLTGLARIKWVTRVSGFHVVRPVVKLADGSWFVGDYAEGAPSSNSTLFLESELAVASVRWLPLDVSRVVTVGQAWVQPDLRKVDEVGFADLLPGSGHGWGGFVNVGRIEVYGKAVRR